MGFCTNVDSVAPDGPVDGTAVARSSSKGGLFGFLRRGNGRLEGPAQTHPTDAKAVAAPSRDGLHSAPGSELAAVASPKPKAERAGLHSAPADRKSAALSLPAENSLSLSEFILERPDGATAAEVDAYLSDILGAAAPPARPAPSRSLTQPSPLAARAFAHQPAPLAPPCSQGPRSSRTCARRSGRRA